MNGDVNVFSEKDHSGVINMHCDWVLNNNTHNQ